METTRDDSLSSRFTGGALHSVSYLSYLELKIAVLENMFKRVICLDSPNVTEFYGVMFSLLGLRSFLSACPYFAHQLLTSHE